MLKNSRAVKFLVPFTLAGVLLAGCAGGGTDTSDDSSDSQPPSEPTGTLRINWGSVPSSWAPGARTEPGMMYIPYESLVQLGENYEILPNLATEWVEDETSLTLTLRDDVTFHDGTPFNAEAVKTNIEYVRDNPGSYSGPLQVVESVEVVDEYTVQINFSAPAPSFLTMLTRNNVLIASPAAIEDGSIVENPVGTGPWAYDAGSSVEGTRWMFTLNEDYWGEQVYFENVEAFGIEDDTAAVGALLNDEIAVTDVENDQQPRIEGVANIDSYEYPAVRNNVVFFDRAPGGVFGDANVRKAMCYAMDVAGLTEVPNQSLIDSPQQHFLEGDPGYNPDIAGYPPNLEEAQAVLDGATVEATFPAAVFLKGQLEYLADNMNQLDGVEVSVQDLAIPDFQSTWNSGQYALGVGQNAEMTPFDWYQAWFAEDSGQNPSGYESPELKAAADAAIAAGSSEEADALWQEVMKVIIDDEALACAFAVGGQTIGWDTNDVAGVQPPPSLPYSVNVVDYRSIYPVTSEE
ncbi:ABC transporter substrate-binding protein [Microbacterium sp. LRZ72]|uniref:ABC transporter substrate-binding protein n=1 Tax=Microbacterium sp. LRZ72 TaxID=2942481 RepID=UPI0029B16ADE|nr:ABC transporter substrate-binding protein [Microbacterium sp. LRZ72]MDX2377525.1 ABC transporter substrate-binding protein [Microbacterium sp. LRZ72]